MNVLGISQVQGQFAWVHDSAAAIVKDGVLVASAEEERFNRIRHARGYPHQAIDYCLKEAGLKPEDVDIVAIAQSPVPLLRQLWKPCGPRTFARKLLNVGILYAFRDFAKERFPRATVVYVPHHRAHAASAWRCSGFPTANVLTVDGSGEEETFTFFEGKDGRLRKVWDIKLDGLFGRGKKNSIGFIYSSVTNLLKLGLHGEGKTMGLASYGTPRFDFSDILSVKDHRRFTLDRGKIAERFKAIAPARAGDPLTQEQKDLAASLQTALEEAVVALAREAHAETGIRDFCMAGGVALNCNTNSRILAEDFCDRLYVQPAANDGGTALGAALEAASVHDRPINVAMDTAYLGPGFSDAEIEALLIDARVRYEKREDIEAATADLLAEGKIVGWFQGRMELGPRALCHRSILADPTIPGMNDRVNDVKHREKWRPLAPVVLEEDSAVYFDPPGTSAFMLLTFAVKPEWREKLPAITHVDGTARIQTVSASQDARMHRLLQEFKKRKGISILMNTSFNDQGEPIVCTPKDALRCFATARFDALVMGSFIVRK